VQRTAEVRFVIAFVIRSGSTLLCHDLAANGLGAPTEHFQTLPEPGQTSADRVRELVAAAAPVFGTKLSWEQTFVLLRALADEGEAIPTFDLRHVFGDDVRVVHVVRRNKIRQALSAWRAATTEVWHVVGDDPAPSAPALERDAVVEVLAQMLAEEHLWKRYFEDTRAQVLTVTYEDYVDDRAAWIRRIAEHIGVPLDQVVLSEGLHPIADEWTDAHEAEILSVLSAPEHPFWLAPSLGTEIPDNYMPVHRRVPIPWTPPGDTVTAETDRPPQRRPRITPRNAPLWAAALLAVAFGLADAVTGQGAILIGFLVGAPALACASGRWTSTAAAAGLSLLLAALLGVPDGLWGTAHHAVYLGGIATAGLVLSACAPLMARAGRASAPSPGYRATAR
jgi:LPS sulfotransferase NodH